MNFELNFCGMNYSLIHSNKNNDYYKYYLYFQSNDNKYYVLTLKQTFNVKLSSNIKLKLIKYLPSEYEYKLNSNLSSQFIFSDTMFTKSSLSTKFKLKKYEPNSLFVIQDNIPCPIMENFQNITSNNNNNVIIHYDTSYL